MGAWCQALLNKDKKEDLAFLLVPSPWLHFQDSHSHWGCQVPLDLLWLVGSPSHPPHEYTSCLPWGVLRPQSMAGNQEQAEACLARKSLSFSGTKQPVFIRKCLAASHPPEIWDHHPSSAYFPRPFFFWGGQEKQQAEVVMWTAV